jgi:hypothetical protein
MLALWSWSYWFALTPPPYDVLQYRVAGAIALALFIGGAAIRIIVRKRSVPAFAKKPWLQLGTLGILVGLSIAVYSFFRFEGIALMGSRFWMLLIAIGVLVRIGFIIRHALVAVPRQRREYEDQKRSSRYRK